MALVSVPGKLSNQSKTQMLEHFFFTEHEHDMYLETLGYVLSITLNVLQLTAQYIFSIKSPHISKFYGKNVTSMLIYVYNLVKM